MIYRNIKQDTKLSTKQTKNSKDKTFFKKSFNLNKNRIGPTNLN